MQQPQELFNRHKHVLVNQVNGVHLLVQVFLQCDLDIQLMFVIHQEQLLVEQGREEREGREENLGKQGKEKNRNKNKKIDVNKYLLFYIKYTLV
jgi:hypothetical protein